MALKLQKYNVITSSGKKFQIIAASKEQAIRMVGKAVPGAVVNPKKKRKNPEITKAAYERRLESIQRLMDGTDVRSGEYQAAERAFMRVQDEMDKAYGSTSWPKGRKRSRKHNPSELLRSGEWTPAHAIRIRKGKLEILR